MDQTQPINPKKLFFSGRIKNALDGIFDHPLTIVEAPMGYGKTTAVKTHLNNAGVNVLWQLVYDGASGIFWSGFCKLFAGLDAGCSSNLARLGLPDDSISRQEAWELVEGVRLPGKTALVIDDYHLIRNTDINDFLVFLAKNEIAGLHVVLITRLVSLEPLDELKLKGYAHHVTKEIFELTSEEIAGYYKLCGINLTVGQTIKLYEFTEGWISALYLLMLDFIKEGRFFSEMTGLSELPTPNIYNLVEKAIYTPLSAELRDFLLRVSIFDNFTMEQAAHIWQKSNTGQLLTNILAENGFLVYDPKIKTYHLHTILTNYLRDKLAATDPVYRQELYQKAGGWYLEAGDYLKAMHCFYLSGDFDRLLQALETDRADSIDGENKESLIKYFEECPRETLASHPTALGFMGRCMFIFNERERFERICRIFTSSIQSGGNLNQRQRNRLLGEYERLLAQKAYNDMAAMSRHHRRSCELLSGISSVGDLTESWTLYGSPSSLYLFYRESGKLEQAVAEAFKALTYYSEATHDTGQAAGYIMAAERHFLTGEFENAEIIIHRVLAGNPEYHPAIRMRGLFLQTRLALVKGDFGAASSLLRRLREDIHQNKLYLFMHSLDLCEAFIYAGLGQKAKIPPWIAGGEFKKTRLVFPVLGFVNIVYGRVLLIHDEYAKLIGNADYFMKTASFYPNILGQIYTYIQLAAACQQLNRKDEALSRLKQALEVAIPDGIVMPFVENGDYIKPLLEELFSDGLYCGHIAKVLELYTTCRKVTEHFSGEKPKLTVRELAVAQLAAVGLTNRGIGERLFITENTVKMMLKNIFAKLAINNRAVLGRYLDKLK